MKKLDEETALSILFANTKRKKRNIDLLNIAKCCKYLVHLYGSQKDVAKKTGLSPEMIRQFLTVLKLPKEVKKMFAKRQIDSVDVAKELVTMNDSTQQIIAANTIVNSLSKDVRDIKRLFKQAGITMKEAKKIISAPKQKGLNIFMIDFDNETYRSITRYAKKLKIKPAELVRKIVINWLKRKSKNL